MARKALPKKKAVRPAVVLGLSLKEAQALRTWVGKSKAVSLKGTPHDYIRRIRKALDSVGIKYQEDLINEDYRWL